MTTYAPKFPKTHTFRFLQNPKGPLSNYDRMIALRNFRVSIGAKLNYGS